MDIARTPNTRRTVLLSLSALSLGGLSGCGPADILNALAPKEDASRRVAKDVAYGPLPRQKYDLYAPKDHDGELPVIIFYYGGGWYMGDKSLYSFAGRALAALGYVVAIPDYRLYPEVVYPDFLYDCAKAYGHIAKNTRAFGAKEDTVVLMGHSAGAYNSVMLALDKTYLNLPDDGSSPLKAVVGISGPYDFYPFEIAASKNAFGQWPKPDETQPIHYVRQMSTRFLLLQSRDDEVVGTRNLTSLEHKLKAAGTQVATRLYDKVNHQDMVAALSIPFRNKASTLADIEAFLEESLKV